MIRSFKEGRHLLVLYKLCVLLQRLPRIMPPEGRMLVLAPHPDDEILGAGGCIIAASERNNSVHVVYLTDGEGSASHHEPDRIRIERKRLKDNVLQLLGIPSSQQHNFHLPDGAVPRKGEPGFEDTVSLLAKLIDTIKPDNVVSTHPDDYWPYDHVACAELAIAAVSQSAHKPDLYGYWVWAWYNLRPWQVWQRRNHALMRIDISPWYKRKQELISIYLDAKSPEGLPWSGVLPYSLRLAFRFRFEVVEKIKIS
jgi:LmbE family N-acetylglucosaminyl deacetylase